MAKIIKFDTEARSKMIRGVDTLAILSRLHWVQKEEMLYLINPMVHPDQQRMG